MSIGKTALSEAGIHHQEQSLAIREKLIHENLYRSVQTFSDKALETPSAPGNDLWRIASHPFYISPQDYQFLNALGDRLLSFYQAANRLYFESVRGHAPTWVADYLDRGKPESVVEMGRMNRFKQDLPGIIRPDLIPTETGMIASELDSVPGGIGLTSALYEAYAPFSENGGRPVMQRDSMLEGFERMIRSRSTQENPFLAIVVSEESRDYRSEMLWLAKRLRSRGLEATVAEPREIYFSEEGLSVEVDGHLRSIDVLYRFFELFDLKNIPKSELMLYAAKKKKVVMTPPPKAQLEEKSLFALFHHPILKTYWQHHLGAETTKVLEHLFPQSWMMDPSAVPPHTVIPDLRVAGQGVQDFRDLGRATQKERQFVIKPSGFSEGAWGSRGVSVGHDLSETDWQAAIDQALDRFSTTPYILQKFHKGKKVSVEYLDFEKDETITMEGRVRLSPYYFVEGKKTHLGGILATVCSLEKKLIHGMVDAVMAPCVVSGNELR